MTRSKVGFSAWHSWARRRELPDVLMPGVYAVAITSESLDGIPFRWLESIRYIGMTVATSGLRGRLGQFDSTLRGKTRHGGADRVAYRYPDYERLLPRLYVAVAAVPCSVKSLSAQSLRCMGLVVQLEYECLARYRERHGALPWFNDKARSPKASKAVST